MPWVDYTRSRSASFERLKLSSILHGLTIYGGDAKQMNRTS